MLRQSLLDACDDMVRRLFGFRSNSAFNIEQEGERGALDWRLHACLKLINEQGEGLNILKKAILISDLLQPCGLEMCVLRFRARINAR